MERPVTPANQKASLKRGAGVLGVLGVLGGSAKSDVLMCCGTPIKEMRDKGVKELAGLKLDK